MTPMPEEPSSQKEYKKPTVGDQEIIQLTQTSAIINSKVEADGGVSVKKRGICYVEGEGLPSIENQITEAQSVRGSGEFTAALNGLKDGVHYTSRAYAVNDVGVGYGAPIGFQTESANKPVVVTGNDFVVGADQLYLRASLENDGGLPVSEKGVCWSEKVSPTIEDKVVHAGEGLGDYLVEIKGLMPEKNYFIRAYAKSEKGISYGQTLEVKTKPRGQITYTLHKELDPSDEVKAHYNRIESAFDEAVEYYNRFTTIEKHLNVYYNPGVPTADGNINGTIRVGANTGYQRAGTAMHEIAHVVGVGTHWKWGQLIQNGIFSGNRTNKILQLLNGDEEAKLKGDGAHFWPYGINGAHEDSGEAKLYTWHALIVQGMKIDGLPSN
ncbi:hypothetical protein GCM10028791_05270 [Echinicola sediminis]